MFDFNLAHKTLDPTRATASAAASFQQSHFSFEFYLWTFISQTLILSNPLQWPLKKTSQLQMTTYPPSADRPFEVESCASAK